MLPYVLNVDDAMEEGASLVHDETGSNISLEFDSFPGNHGDVEEMFAASAFTVESRLSASRQHAFARMEKAISESLAFLNMPGIRMALQHETGPLTADGRDKLFFLISTNPGEPPKPLAKIASGGELARIMLAIKNTLADKDDIPTIIYDEVDAGISGLSAGRIGQLLRNTARRRHVLCVTHTAQVAAWV